MKRVPPVRGTACRGLQQLVIMAVVLGLIGSVRAGTPVPVVVAQPTEDEATAQQTTTPGPQPGDVFREYTFPERTDECGPDAVRRQETQGDTNCTEDKRAQERTFPQQLTIDNASKAEIAIQFWGGHIGTSDQRFVINRSKDELARGTSQHVYAIPQPATSGRAECYFRNSLGRSVVPVPLSEFRNGTNSLRFWSGNQSGCNGTFNWGLYWVYHFTARIYYNSSVPHPTGRILTPGNAARIGDNPTIVVEAASPNSRVARVDLIGEYDDFDWDGNGVWREWQYRMENDQWTATAGTRTSPDAGTTNRYSFTWDTTWIPDQDRPIRFMARITDQTGMSYMTPAVTYEFRRGGRSVRLYRVTDFPPNFDVREGRPRRGADIRITDDLGSVNRARLVMSSWGGDAGASATGRYTEIRFNDQRIAENYGSSSPQVQFGRYHSYSDDIFNLSANQVRSGNNRFEMHSSRTGHALEIHWPGPVLLVERAVPNRAPTINAPDTLSVPKETDTQITGVRVDDPDASDQDTVEVRLQVSRGVLLLRTTTGLSFQSGADGHNSMTIRGTLPRINAALDGMIYRPNRTFSGGDQLRVTINDLGTRGGGGAQSASATANITVRSSSAPVDGEYQVFLPSTMR